jgi:hypothetical protein
VYGELSDVTPHHQRLLPARRQRRFNVDLGMLYGDTFSQPVRRWEIRFLAIRQIAEDNDPIIPLVRKGWRPLMMSR